MTLSGHGLILGRRAFDLTLRRVGLLYQPSLILTHFVGAKSIRPGRRGAKRDAGTSGKRRPDSTGHPVGRFAPPVRPGAIGRRRRRSPLEVSGTTARLAPIPRAKIAAVKWVNIKDRWYYSATMRSASSLVWQSDQMRPS